jgi:ribosomal protein L35AE/L33A
MVFILILGFGDSFELRSCPCLLRSKRPLWNIRAELKPFFTIFGTSMRAKTSFGLRHGKKGAVRVKFKEGVLGQALWTAVELVG